MLSLILILLTVLMTITTIGVNGDYVRGCYYTNWAKYSRPPEYTYNISKFDPTLCNTVFYAFATIHNETYELTHSDWEDPDREWGKSIWREMMNYKQVNPNLKVILSVGGWNFNNCTHTLGKYTCHLFSTIAADSTLTYKFAISAVKLLREYGFDGLDLDWEFPGKWDQNRYVGANQPEHDKANFVSMISRLRQTFEIDASTRVGVPRLLLSVAVGIGPTFVDNAYDVPKICDTNTGADHVNLMTYDMHGPWDRHTGHHMPLYSTVGDDAAFGFTLSIASVIDYWISRGCYSEKLLLGLGAYGKGFSLASSYRGFLAPVRGASGRGPGLGLEGTMAYKEIVSLLASGALTEYWDDARGVSYAYNDVTWIGYDNPRSIQLKTAYVKMKHLGGAFLWSLDFDQFTDKEYPLLRAMNLEFDKVEYVTSAEIAPDVCLTATIASSVDTRTTELVAQFPQGAWDTQDCSEASLADLVSNCKSYLASNATDAEILGCRIIQDRNFIPLGGFGSVPIEAELNSFDFESLGNVFDTCGLARLIDDACFAYTRNTWPAFYEVNQFVTDKNYTTIHSDKFSVSETVEMSASLGVNITPSITKAKIGANLKASRKLQGIKTKEHTGGRKTARQLSFWSNDIGILSIDSCIQSVDAVRYLKKEYLDLWRALEDIKIPRDLSYKDEFSQIIHAGLFIPTTFGFAVRFESDVTAHYDATIEKNEYVMDEIFTNSLKVTLNTTFNLPVGDPAKIEVRVPTFEKKFSGEDTKTYIRKASKTYNLITSISGSTKKYGKCNFDLLFANPENWSIILHACAIRNADDMANFPTSAYIPRGGFKSAMELAKWGGVRVDADIFEEALNIFNTYCVGFTENYHHKARCYFGNDIYSHELQTYQNTDGQMWWYRNLPQHSRFENGKWVMEVISPNRHVRLVFEKDSNLVLYVGTKAKWFSNTAGTVEYRMRSSPGLIMLQYYEAIPPGSSTLEYGALIIAKLEQLNYESGFLYVETMLDDDASLKFYDQNQRIVGVFRFDWVCPPTSILRVYGYAIPGKVLMTSPTGIFSMILEADGNLVLYQNSQSQNNVRWTSNTPASNVRVIFDKLQGALKMESGANFENVQHFFHLSSASTYDGLDFYIMLADDGSIRYYQIETNVLLGSLRIITGSSSLDLITSILNY